MASQCDRRDGRTAEDGNIRVLVLLFGLYKAILFRTYIRLILYCCYDLQRYLSNVDNFLWVILVAMMDNAIFVENITNYERFSILQRVVIA